MTYRPFGTTGLTVSAVGLGTWAFASGAYGTVTDADSHAAVQAALDSGVTVFDTAPLYGNAQEDGIAETVLGRALGKRRDDALIFTKFGRNPTDGYRPAFHAARATQSIDESLKRLGTDHIDVLFFHSPFSPDEINDDVWAGLGAAQQAGKVRVIGHSISMFAQTEAMARQWAAERRIGAVQTVLSLLNRESLPLIAEVAALGVGVVARESLANGFLSGTVTRETVFPENNLNRRYSRDEISARVEQIERLSFLVRGDVTTLPQAALRWVLDQVGVAMVLTGAKNAAEVVDGVAAAEKAPFTADELARAAAVHTRDFAAA